VADNVTDVILKLRMEIDDLQKGQKKVKTELDKTKKVVQQLNTALKKDQTSAFNAVTKAAKDSAGKIIKDEKKKQDAVKGTTTQIEKQKGKYAEAAKSAAKFAASKGGKYLAAFAGGAGLGMLDPRGMGVGKMFGAAGRAVSRTVGGLVGFGVTGMSNAYQQYMQYGQALGGLVGLGSARQLAAGRRGAGRAGGASLGYNVMETAMQAGMVGRATGNIGAVYKAQQFARATGMDVGEAGGYMGMVRQAGYGFGGQAMGPGGQLQQVGQSGPKQLEKIIAAGMISGIEKSRLSEYMQGVSSIVGAAGGRRAGVVDTSGISAFMAMLGKSGNAGFQGARGAAVGAQLHQAVMQPGGGEAGQAMMLQALGFGKPGGQTTYYEALKKQQMGLERPENVMAMFKEVYSQRGVTGEGGDKGVQQEANLVLSKMTGLSLDQVEKLGNILNSGKSAEDQMKGIKAQMEKSEPIEKQSLKEMQKGFGGIVKHTAHIFDETVNIGRVVAPLMMTIQSVQLKLLGELVKLVPELLDWVKQIVVQLKFAFKELILIFLRSSKIITEEQFKANELRAYQARVEDLRNPYSTKGKIFELEAKEALSEYKTNKDALNLFGKSPGQLPKGGPGVGDKGLVPVSTPTGKYFDEKELTKEVYVTQEQAAEVAKAQAQERETIKLGEERKAQEAILDKKHSDVLRRGGELVDKVVKAVDQFGRNAEKYSQSTTPTGKPGAANKIHKPK
jgi:hypothetical protein